MTKIQKFLISLVILLALILRLYKIDNPIADWHSFRQADTASVTQEWVKNSLNFLVPTYHDHSNIQSGKDNPNGYRMVEMPIYNLAHYWLYQLFPGLGVDKSGRLTSVLFSIISIYTVFLIVKRLSGFLTGLFASLFMTVLPFSIYYSRVILPEPLAIMALLLSFYYILKANDDQKNHYLWLLLSSLLLSVSILVKPYSIFFTLPHIAIYLRLIVQQKLSPLSALAYIAISLTPFVGWRLHIAQYPTGIPASDWLLNSSGIRFRPAWFRWLFGERLGKLILGVWGTGFLMLGLISKPKKEGLTYWLWFLGILIYFSVIAGGNVQHDYYQSLIIPFLAVILAKGLTLVLNLSKDTYSRWLTILMAIVMFVGMIAMSWYDIKGYYQINNYPIVTAGIAVDSLVEKDALVIAPYNGDTAFLYQTRRSGWPIGYDIEDKIAKGANYYVSVSYDDEARDLEKKYETVQKTDEFIIINLNKKVSP